MDPAEIILDKNVIRKWNRIAQAQKVITRAKIRVFKDLFKAYTFSNCPYKVYDNLSRCRTFTKFTLIKWRFFIVLAFDNPAYNQSEDCPSVPSLKLPAKSEEETDTIVI